MDGSNHSTREYCCPHPEPRNCLAPGTAATAPKALEHSRRSLCRVQHGCCKCLHCLLHTALLTPTNPPTPWTFPPLPLGSCLLQSHTQHLAQVPKRAVRGVSLPLPREEFSPISKIPSQLQQPLTPEQQLSPTCLHIPLSVQRSPKA